MNLRCDLSTPKIQMNRRLASIFLILTSLVLLSCGDPTAPEDLLEEDLYVSVFSELLIINQINEQQLDGISRDYLKEQVFEEYDVTREQFEQTHRYFQQQPEQQLERLSKIEETLMQDRDRFQDRINEDRKRLADSLAVADSLTDSDSVSVTDPIPIPPPDSVSIPDSLSSGRNAYDMNSNN